MSFQKKKVLHISESRSDSWQNGGNLQRGLTASPQSCDAKFASQCDARMRTEAQIKFLYYPLMIQVNTEIDM